MSRNIEIEVGMTFSAPYADTSVLWKVAGSRGRGDWSCEIDASEPDYAGTRSVFSGEDIRRAVDMDRLLSEAVARRADFWAAADVGSLLHYHNAFGQFVRCTVVLGTDSEGKTAKVLKPEALVGNWREFDLPRWLDTGVFLEGCHHARMIAAGETFQPHESCIWESAQFAGRGRHEDPTELTAFDLSHPEPTAAQAEAAELNGLIETIRGVLTPKSGPTFAVVRDWPEEYRERLAEVKKIIDDAGLDLDPRSHRM